MTKKEAKKYSHPSCLLCPFDQFNFPPSLLFFLVYLEHLSSALSSLFAISLQSKKQNLATCKTVKRQQTSIFSFFVYKKTLYYYCYCFILPTAFIFSKLVCSKTPKQQKKFLVFTIKRCRKKVCKVIHLAKKCCY